MTEQEQAIEAMKLALHAHAKEGILSALKAHKAKHGTNELERVGFVAAFVQFCNFIGGNKLFVVGPETDVFLNFGIEVISAAAAEAKKQSEENRIILV